jgi:hypothetical protein
MVVAAWSIGLDGLTPLAGVSARSASVSLVFTDAANQLRPELTSTSSSAWGAAFGLDPGPVRLEFSHLDSGLRCGGIAKNGTIETSVEVNLQAGGVTLLNVYCYV